MRQGDLVVQHDMRVVSGGGVFDVGQGADGGTIVAQGTPGSPAPNIQYYLVPDGTRDWPNTSIMARLKAGISSGWRLETRFPSITAS